MWSLTWQKQKIVVVQKLAVPTDVAAMIALATARPHAATMGAVVKIAMITVAKAKNS